MLRPNNFYIISLLLLEVHFPFCTRDNVFFFDFAVVVAIVAVVADVVTANVVDVVAAAVAVVASHWFFFDFISVLFIKLFHFSPDLLFHSNPF